MRFTINKEEFQKALSIVSRPIPSKSYVATLIFVKLVLDDNGLTLIGSNETIAISSTIPFSKDGKDIITNYKNGAVLVQGKYLVEIVKRLSSQELSFDVMDNAVVEISTENFSSKLNSTAAEEYPDYDFNEEGTSFTVNTKDFISLIEQTSFAAQVKENRPMLTAINLTGNDNKLTAIALDAARYSRKIIGLTLTSSFVANVPAKTLNEIIRMFDNVPEVNVVVNERKIFFKFNNTIISSNLINGDYPNVSHIVPQSFAYSLEVNAHEFLEAMERVSLVTNDKHTIKLTMTSEQIEISSTVNEIGSANEKINTFQYNGDRLEILFNSIYVADAIKALRSEDIIIEFNGEMKPFVVRNPNDANIIELITPVRA